MERLVKGDVVVVPFPFSDTKTSKRRPAMVLAVAGNEIVLVEITSKKRHSDDISISQNDLKQGTLKVMSWARPLRLVTIHLSLVLYKIGPLKVEKRDEIINKICGLLRD